MAEDRILVRGAKIKIFPNDEQRRQLDLWRTRAISLWNLLLGMEQAAYDGSPFRPELGWRRIWADVVWSNYETAMDAWETGKTIRMGKHKGKFQPPRKKFDKDGNLVDAPRPVEPTIKQHFQIGGHWVNGEAPKLFLWEDELLKLMARLKRVELSQWIGDLHSHAAQAVCSDIVLAIQAMLREMKKGEAGQDTGFPRFKKQGYAAGSIYFANTQIKFDFAGHVTISNGIGEMPCGSLGKPRKNPSLRVCRAWREGEQWWLSVQWRFEADDPLPARNRACGVKVAASAVYTVFDGEDFRQVFSRQPSPREEALLAIKGRRATRKGKAPSGKRSQGWYEAQAVLARTHAHRRNCTADVIHKGSRAIVEEFDSIKIDKMDIKSMMKKGKSKREKRRERLGKPKDIRSKKVRKMMARAAMYDAAQKVIYKSEEVGSTVEQTHVLLPSTQICCVCGKLHVSMASGKRTLICECGNKLNRQKNSAVVIANF